MSSKSSSKSFIARCGRDAEGGEHSTRQKKRSLCWCSKHHVSSRIVYTHIDFSHIVSNSLSLIKKRDLKEKKTKNITRENRKTQTLFYFVPSRRVLRSRA